MAVFPTPVEREVASALLRLATTPPSLSPPPGRSKCDGDDSQCFVMVSGSDMNCSWSAKASDGGVLNSAKAQSHHQMVPVAWRHELKLKVPKKRRSKSYWISDCQKIKPANSWTAPWGPASGARRARSQTPSSTMHHRAEAILRVLSHGLASEAKLRQLLGDNPDTSKALRMLLKQDEVKRSGAGGRSDPYIYTKA